MAKGLRSRAPNKAVDEREDGQQAYVAHPPFGGGAPVTTQGILREVLCRDHQLRRVSARLSRPDEDGYDPRVGRHVVCVLDGAHRRQPNIAQLRRVGQSGQLRRVVVSAKRLRQATNVAGACRRRMSQARLDLDAPQRRHT
eukprot:690830-Prymnesium_polylepis.3